MTVGAIVLLGFSLVVTGYAYAGYPLLLQLIAWARRGNSAKTSVSVDDWPMITITVPVYNEEASIEATLECILALDYPVDRRHVLVISDASTDRTDEIVRTYRDRGVQLVRLPRRMGKTAAENEAGKHLRGTIVVNIDASVRVHPRALKPLIASFADPSVGVASGRDVSISRDGNQGNVGELGYVGYEMWLRQLETLAGGIVGASGCFFAVRRELHTGSVPPALSWDFAAPLIACEQGFRSVSVEEAICFVPRTRSLRREYRRKLRTMTRGLETLNYKRQLLNPLRYRLFAWKLFSHKLARWLVPWAAVASVLGLAALAITQVWAQLLLAAAALVLILALTGWLLPEERKLPRVVGLPSYLVAGIVAGLVAWIRAARGELNPIWEPTRRGT